MKNLKLSSTQIFEYTVDSDITQPIEGNASFDYKVYAETDVIPEGVYSFEANLIVKSSDGNDKCQARLDFENPDNVGDGMTSLFKSTEIDSSQSLMDNFVELDKLKVNLVLMTRALPISPGIPAVSYAKGIIEVKTPKKIQISAKMTDAGGFPQILKNTSIFLRKI